MPMSDTAPTSVLVRELLDRSARGDWPWVERAMATWGEPPGDAVLLQVARQCMQGQRWGLGLGLMQQVRQPEAELKLQRCLAGNLAAMQKHRPHTYQQIISNTDPCQYQLIKGEGDRWAIVQRPTDGQGLKIGPMPLAMPEEPWRRLLEAVQPPDSIGHAVALCGLGEGLLLKHLVPHHWIFWGMFRLQPLVYVIEPDVGLVLHHFMIHDCTGIDGPIERANCFWLIGPGWATQLMQLLEARPTLRFPKIKVPQGRLGKSISTALDPLSDQYVDQLNTCRDRLWHEYEACDVKTLIALLGPNPPRQPRVMLITSRLTTVLQYANRDCQKAFEALGWQTRLLIEPSEYEDTTPGYMLREMQAFKPDVVFMIDSLRLHASSVFPPQVLHMGWVQDDLARLINIEAGRSVGPLDFVGLPAGPWYCKKFAYPTSQCIFLDKLTRPVQRPASWNSEGDDLVYVSNNGKPMELALREMIQQYQQASPVVVQIIEAVGEHLQQVYEGGGHLHSPNQIRTFIQSLQPQRGWKVNNPQALDQLVTMLFNRLNNTMYRHQVVRWLIDLSRRHGLQLSLYGSGWDEHPEFAEYARGRVAYGSDLEQLTRKSKINLQVVPFGCMHQRLLDGLVAGGFFLVREHPWDRLLATVWGLVQSTGDDDRLELAKVLPRLQPRSQQQLREIAELYRVIYDDTDDDPVRRCRDMIEAGCQFMLQPFPAMDDTFFTTPAQLEKQVMRYVNDASARREIQQQQCAFVEAHLTYQAGLSRLMKVVHQRLANQSMCITAKNQSIAPSATGSDMATGEAQCA